VTGCAVRFHLFAFEGFAALVLVGIVVVLRNERPINEIEDERDAMTTSTITKQPTPLVKWAGGKRQLLDRIAARMPSGGYETLY